MGKSRVELARNGCQGFGACIELFPNSFPLLEVDGRSFFPVKGAEKVKKDDEVTTEALEMDERESVREGAEACPLNAIPVINLETDASSNK